MRFIEIFLLVYLVINLIVQLIFIAKIKNPFKNAITGIAISFVLLAIINTIAFFTGIYIPINWHTIISSAAFGIPGIAGLIILQSIFML